MNFPNLTTASLLKKTISHRKFKLQKSALNIITLEYSAYNHKSDRCSLRLQEHRCQISFKIGLKYAMTLREKIGVSDLFHKFSNE